MTIAPKSSKSDGPMLQDTETSSSLTEKNLSQSTLSVGVSPANQSRLQGGVVAHLTKDGFGESLHESFAKLSQDGLWLKTSQGCYQQTLDGHLQKFSGTWPRAGTMLSGTCFQREDRVALARRTKGKEYSLWRTPMAADGTHNHCLAPSVMEGKTTLPLTNQVKGCIQGLWPTPTVSDTEGGLVKNVELRNGSFSRKNKKGVRWGVKLKDDVNHMEMFPTPTARDWKGKSGKGRQERKGNPKDTLPNAVNGQLNPTWVEWLMGFPRGWTDLKHLEMPLSRKSQNKLER